MMQSKNWGRSKKIGDVILWITLAEALSWRRKFDPDISNNKAFEELRAVCSPQHAKTANHWHIWASGKSAGWRPIQGWRSGNLPEYRPLEDPDHPPVHDPEARPIPAEEWPDLVLSSPADIDTGKLDYEYERTVAWVDVRFPRDELIVVWRPLLSQLGHCSPSLHQVDAAVTTTTALKSKFATASNASTAPLEPENITTKSAGDFIEWAKSKRELRHEAKLTMYKTWLSLADKYAFKENGSRRVSAEICSKIAADPAAREPVTTKSPSAGSVKRRLNENFPGWLERVGQKIVGQK